MGNRQQTCPSDQRSLIEEKNFDQNSFEEQEMFGQNTQEDMLIIQECHQESRIDLSHQSSYVNEKMESTMKINF